MYQLETVDLTSLPPTDGILSKRERAYFDTLKFPKRRTEWFGGRLALKRVVSHALSLVDLAQIEILPQDSGKPSLTVGEKKLSLAYSITHSHGFAVAAVSQSEKFLGIDLEKIEHRIAAWKNDFFHPDELTEDNDEFLTALWTQKEALVKLLGTGFALRSNEVCCIKGVAHFAGRALEIYQSLGMPKILVHTEKWPGNFMFSVAEGKNKVL